MATNPRRTRPASHAVQRGRKVDRNKVLEATLKRQPNEVVEAEQKEKICKANSNSEAKPSEKEEIVIENNPLKPTRRSRRTFKSIGVQVSLPYIPRPSTPPKSPEEPIDWAISNDDNNDEDFLRAIEASKLTAPIANCSADGAGMLCNNQIVIVLYCGHGLCQEHSVECPRCDYLNNVASRRLQRAIKKFLFRLKIKRSIKGRNNAAIIITGFLRIIKAKKIKRQLHYQACRQRFLNRLTQGKAE